jgi:hypothetical protein
MGLATGGGDIGMVQGGQHWRFAFAEGEALDFAAAQIGGEAEADAAHHFLIC